MRRSIAILGAGFSGTLTAIHLLQDPNGANQTNIYLIDPRGTFGRGLAYSPPSERFKLNVRAKSMGAFPDDPEEFFRWLKAREPNASPEDFAPRVTYGTYLAELLEKAALSSGSATLVRIADEATEVTFSPSTSKFTITLQNAPALEADACILAVGNLMQTSLGGSGGTEIFRQPFRTESYDDIAHCGRLLIVGSSLTAVDVIIEAEGRGFTGHYTVVSRNGRLPLVHETLSPQPVVSLPDEWETVGSSRTLLKLIRAESRRIGSSQPVFDAIRPKIQTMWINLPAHEKRRFLRHIRPFWDIHRHRIPAEHSGKLRALRHAGKLSLLAGRIATLTASSSTVSATITPRGAQKTPISLDVDAAFMCAGTEGDLSKSRNRLIRSLLSNGLLSAGPLKLGSVQPATNPHDSLPPLWVIGPLQREERWEITAVRELREEALSVARGVHARLSQKSA